MTSGLQPIQLSSNPAVLPYGETSRQAAQIYAHSTLLSPLAVSSDPNAEPHHSSSLLPPSNVDLNASRLVSSPYPDPANQLNVQELDMPNRLLAFALTILRSVRADYATSPYLDAFNWVEVFSLLRNLCQQTNYYWSKTHSFYVVIFRSQLALDIDRQLLGELDQRSHEEACSSGGLLKYWFGSLDDERRNLATCLWRSHEDAVAGGKGPWHCKARAAARHMYRSIDFFVHRLEVGRDAQSWQLHPFRSGQHRA